MLRRTSSRSIAQYNFGHPKLSEVYTGKGVIPTKKSDAVVDHGVKVTQLTNGAKVITHNMEGAQVSVGAYVEAGPMYDPASAPGLSYVMRWAFTTSNYDNSLFQIDRTLRSSGASLEHLEVRKKFIGLRTDSRADMWQKPAENIFTGFAAPRFHESDIERFRDTFDNILSEQRWQQPRTYCTDRLEEVAFYKEPLGNPRHVLPNSNDACSSEKLLDNYAKYVLPSRTVIAGVNVDHSALVSAYENAPFPHSDTAPHHAKTAADRKVIDILSEDRQYTGGEFHEQENRPKEMGTKPDMEYESIAAVGFRSFGRDANLKDYVASLVTRNLFDIAKNDGIRYDRFDTHHGIRSFYRPYAGTGLIGFTARTGPKEINKAVLDSLKEFQNLGVENLAAAKARATAEFFNTELESTRDYCNFLATSFTKGTARVTPEEILAAIQAVSAADVKRVKDIAAASRPSIWVTGETLAFPSLRQLGF